MFLFFAVVKMDELNLQMANVNVANADALMQTDGGDGMNDINTDIKPVIPIVFPEIPPATPGTNEKKKKSEERPVIHRNNGRIGIEKLRRRRLISMSADRASDYFRNLAQQQNHTPNRVSLECARPRNERAASVSIVVRQRQHVTPTNTGSYQQQPQKQLSPPPPPPPPQSQQQQQPSQTELQRLVQLMGNESYCLQCDQEYKNITSLRKHKKTQKHQDSETSITPARQQLLDTAYTQYLANRRQ